MEFERKKLFLYIFISLLVAAIVVYLLFNCYFYVFKVEGNSMLPLLKDSDRVIVKRVNRDFVFKRFDVVILKKEKYKQKIIKRIIGLPKEQIEFQRSCILVNGKKINELYLKGKEIYDKQIIVLSNNEYYLIGDNRKISMDSRSFGPVIKKNIIGKVLFAYFPPKTIY